MRNFLVAEGVGPMSGGPMAAWPITARRNLRERKTSQFKVNSKYQEKIPLKLFREKKN